MGSIVMLTRMCLSGGIGQCSLDPILLNIVYCASAGFVDRSGSVVDGEVLNSSRMAL